MSFFFSSFSSGKNIAISHENSGIKIKGNGIYIIDGKEYKSDEITIRTEYKIKATGESVYTEPDKVQVELRGNRMEVNISSSSGNIDIHTTDGCSFNNVTSSSANIDIHSNDGCSINSVTTSSGDIRFKGNAGRVSSVSGDVTIQGSVQGLISVISGDVRR